MNTKKWFLLFAILILCIPSGYSQAKDVIRKVVIDAGHGGNDPGAIGAKSKEKDITLKMALQVGKLIKESCPDVEVYYTRTTDVFVPLNGAANSQTTNTPTFSSPSIAIQRPIKQRAESKPT